MVAISFLVMGMIGLLVGVTAYIGIFESGIGSTIAIILIVMGAFVFAAGGLRLWDSARASRFMPKTIEVGSDRLSATFVVRTQDGRKMISRTLPFASISDVKPGPWGTARLPADMISPAGAYGRFEPATDGVDLKLSPAQRDVDTKGSDRSDFIYLTKENYERVHSVWATWKQARQPVGDKNSLSKSA
jgi:hypothetical protein